MDICKEYREYIKKTKNVLEDSALYSNLLEKGFKYSYNEISYEEVKKEFKVKKPNRTRATSPFKAFYEIVVAVTDVVRGILFSYKLFLGRKDEVKSFFYKASCHLKAARFRAIGLWSPNKSTWKVQEAYFNIECSRAATHSLWTKQDQYFYLDPLLAKTEKPLPHRHAAKKIKLNDLITMNSSMRSRVMIDLKLKQSIIDEKGKLNFLWKNLDQLKSENHPLLDLSIDALQTNPDYIRLLSHNLIDKSTKLPTLNPTDHIDPPKPDIIPQPDIDPPKPDVDTTPDIDPPKPDIIPQPDIEPPKPDVDPTPDSDASRPDMNVAPTTSMLTIDLSSVADLKLEALIKLREDELFFPIGTDHLTAKELHKAASEYIEKLKKTELIYKILAENYNREACQDPYLLWDEINHWKNHVNQMRAKYLCLVGSLSKRPLIESIELPPLPNYKFRSIVKFPSTWIQLDNWFDIYNICSADSATHKDISVGDKKPFREAYEILLELRKAQFEDKDSLKQPQDLQTLLSMKSNQHKNSFFDDAQTLGWNDEEKKKQFTARLAEIIKCSERTEEVIRHIYLSGPYAELCDIEQLKAQLPQNREWHLELAQEQEPSDAAHERICDLWTKKLPFSKGGGVANRASLCYAISLFQTLFNSPSFYKLLTKPAEEILFHEDPWFVGGEAEKTAYQKARQEAAVKMQQELLKLKNHFEDEKAIPSTRFQALEDFMSSDVLENSSWQKKYFGKDGIRGQMGTSDELLMAILETLGYSINWEETKESTAEEQSCCIGSFETVNRHNGLGYHIIDACRKEDCSHPKGYDSQNREYCLEPTGKEISFPIRRMADNTFDTLREAQFKDRHYRLLDQCDASKLRECKSEGHIRFISNKQPRCLLPLERVYDMAIKELVPKCEKECEHEKNHDKLQYFQKTADHAPYIRVPKVEIVKGKKPNLVELIKNSLEPINVRIGKQEVNKQLVCWNLPVLTKIKWTNQELPDFIPIYTPICASDNDQIQASSFKETDYVERIEVPLNTPIDLGLLSGRDSCLYMVSGFVHRPGSHYMAYLKQPNGRWLCYDDACVYKPSEENLKNDSEIAPLFFFEKIK